MLLVDSIEPEKWYAVSEVARIVGWSEDVVRRWIQRGLIQAFIQPRTSSKRKRVFNATRIQGAELIRFIRSRLTTVAELGR